MGSASPLSYEERKFLEKCIKEGKSYPKIALLLGRHQQTLTHEVKKSGLTQKTYDADIAQNQAHLRKNKISRIKKPPFNPSAEQLRIMELLMAEGKSKYDIRSRLGVSTRRFQKYMSENHPSYKAQYSVGLPSFENRISALEMQIEILCDTIKELHHDIKNK